MSWPGRSHATDVQLRVAADGMVHRVPPRAGEKFASTRTSVQHALSATDAGFAGCGRWQAVHGPAFIGQAPGGEISFAFCDGYYELLNVPQVKSGLGFGRLALRVDFRMRVLSHA